VQRCVTRAPELQRRPAAARIVPDVSPRIAHCQRMTALGSHDT